ncbi:hypothetical protein JCM24511_06938 [Saitozyma sp. JCM 24511]|nr:hypothetical protein JCM24511_06938 [Saitozyma sp. JCM 24511]
MASNLDYRPIPGLPFYDGMSDYKTLHDAHSAAFGKHVIESIPTSRSAANLATEVSRVLAIDVPSSPSLCDDSEDARATRLRYCLESLLAHGRIKGIKNLSLVTGKLHLPQASDAYLAALEQTEQLNQDALAATKTMLIRYGVDRSLPLTSHASTVEKETDLDRATAAFYNLTFTHFMGFKMSGGSLEERAAAANKAFGRVSDVHVPASEELFADSHEGRIRRRLICLQVRNPSDEKLGALYTGSQLLFSTALEAMSEDGAEVFDELDPDSILSTIIAVERFIETRNGTSQEGQGGGQSSASAQ